MKPSVRNKVSGIYLIQNLKNDRAYVGRSHDIPSRFASHISALVSGTHHNKHLQRDCKDYGINNFTFRILEVVDYARPSLNAYLTSLEEKYVLKCNAMHPQGYCERVADLNLSDTRLMTERIVCMDLRSDELFYAEAFSEAALYAQTTAGQVKKAVSSKSHYAKHHLFFFEHEFRDYVPEALEKKIKMGKYYSSVTST